MAERRSEQPAADGPGIPRDLPDQQAQDGGGDRWDTGHPAEREDEESAEELPGIDEAGSGPRGAPEEEKVDPEQPAPDEPAD